MKEGRKEGRKGSKEKGDLTEGRVKGYALGDGFRTS
jgi:hypothetical protein